MGDRPSVAIVGAGAMGGVWAVRLAAGGAGVVAIDAAPAVVQALDAHGLIVEAPGAGAETLALRATSRPEDVGPVDVVFFFVKSYHTAEAASAARPLVAGATTVVSLQNGWGNADVLARCFAADQLVVGVTYHSARVDAPGRIAHTARGATFLGPYAASAGPARAETVGAMLAAGGLEVTVTPQVRTEIWKKLVLNAATLPTSALTRLRTGPLGEPGPTLDLLDVLAREATAVARAQGFEIDPDERVEYIHRLLRGGGSGKSSMLQDVEAGRRTEIDVINGAVVRAAAAAGVAVPVNQAMVALVLGLERAMQP